MLSKMLHHVMRHGQVYGREDTDELGWPRLQLCDSHVIIDA